MSDAMADFLRGVDTMAVQRAPAPSWPLYESLKAEFRRRFPETTPDQYAYAMQKIARAAGV